MQLEIDKGDDPKSPRKGEEGSAKHGGTVRDKKPAGIAGHAVKEKVSKNLIPKPTKNQLATHELHKEDEDN